MTSKELLKILKKDGWQIERINWIALYPKTSDQAWHANHSYAQQRFAYWDIQNNSKASGA